MSDGVSSFSSPLFSEVNALERTTVQEINSGLGFTSLDTPYVLPVLHRPNQRRSPRSAVHFFRARTDEGARGRRHTVAFEGEG